MFSKKATQFNQFLYFDNSTRGTDGRPVFIDPMLLPKYMEFVVDNQFHRESTKTLICNLKNSAGNVTASNNLQSAHTHRSHCGALVVTYAIVQDKPDNSHGPGVYITDITQAVKGEKDGGPGFYRVNSQNYSWNHQLIKDQILPTLVGSIGAVIDPKSMEYSLETTQFSIGTELDHIAAKYIKGDGFSLYYSPSYTIDDYGTWLPSSAANHQAGPARLAQILANTQKQYWGEIDSPHLWYVFGRGALLLEKALAQLPALGISKLNYHQFEFISPNSNLPLLQQKLAQLGSKTAFKNLQLDSLSSRFHQITHNPAQLNTPLATSKVWQASAGPLKKGYEFVHRAVNQVLPYMLKDLNDINANFMALVERATQKSSW